MQWRLQCTVKSRRLKIRFQLLSPLRRELSFNLNTLGQLQNLVTIFHSKYNYKINKLLDIYSPTTTKIGKCNLYLREYSGLGVATSFTPAVINTFKDYRKIFQNKFRDENPQRTGNYNRNK